jgi:hypothetical protein
MEKAAGVYWSHFEDISKPEQSWTVWEIVIKLLCFLLFRKYWMTGQFFFMIHVNIP